MKRVVVTGSEGFIGSNVVRILKNSGFEVFSMDIAASGGPNEINMDIRNLELGTKLLEIKPDVIIHCAAQIYVMDSLENPENDLSINGFGTLNLVHASIKAKVTNFIYIHSGGAVYDSNNSLPIEEDNHEFPQSPYGLTKALGEGYVRILCSAAGISWTSLALSNVFGSIKNHRKGVIFEFANAILQNRAVQIYGKSVTRDYVHIDDVTQAVFSAISKPTLCRVNISSAIETSNLQLFELIKNKFGSEVTSIIHEARSGEVLRSCLSNRKAKEILDWSPKIDLKTGISMILEDVQ
jgi:UDP-glucose 4-epimerase